MGKRREAIRFSKNIVEDRIINKFQLPYNINYTPYKKVEFNRNTMQLCKDAYGISVVSFASSKVIILGDASVGKTSIINRFCHKLFQTNYKATIGVDFEVERFDIMEIPFCLQIWDTAGQERFQSIAQCYYRGANAIVLVFDLSNISTLYNCQKWLREALNACNSNDPFIFLVGTKKDLLSSASYLSVEKSGVRIATKLNAEYWPMSSKSGENINQFFYRIACLVFEMCSKHGNQDKTVTNIETLSFQKSSSKRKTSQTSFCTNASCR